MSVRIGQTGKVKIASLLFCVVFAASGCTEGLRAIQVEDESSSNAPETPAPTAPGKPKYASWGTGELNVAKGVVRELQLNSSDASRYYIYVPPGYNEGEPMGLVMLFHGVEGTSDPHVFMDISAYVSEDRFILISPVGDISHGGSGAWCQPYSREIQELVEGKYNVDLRRKYVAAVSGGGLPAVQYALHGTKGTYSFCGRSIKAGYQGEFAAYGFTASAYSPSRFPSLEGLNANELGFTPKLWADYGELSRDAGTAQNLVNWAENLGIANELHERSGEGHAPDSPYDYMFGMFDMFASTFKPIAE